jgi:serine/threonine-protein kinase
MSIIGEALSNFRVTAKLGEGGMGEVYRAHDTVLGREVAIKILPEAVAADPERLARFEREARVLASLNHPNIAHLYGLETATVDSGTGTGTGAGTQELTFLVMELVEGEGLDERIARGPVPVDEAVGMAVQIAEALEAAHAKGIVHRDLKPANVKIDPDGRVRVLDFGLAKALAPDGEASASGVELSLSPTLTAHMTQAGVLLGTAAYMSPEQARGRGADRRSDVWAFGCVLMEMLTGDSPFAGDTVADILGAIVHREPDWDALPSSTPQAVRRLLRRCLRREPRNRLHDIADARIELEDARGADPPEAVAAATPAPAWRRVLPWAMVVALAVIAVGSMWRAWAPRGDTILIAALEVGVPEGQFLPDDEFPILDVSADGRTMAFVTDGQNGRRVYVRTLDRLEARPVAGTEGAVSPTLSPDGRWVAFFTGNTLLKVPVEGGSPVALAEAPANRGVDWGPDGWIVLSPTFNTGLVRVAETGGTPQILTEPDRSRQERTHRWPQVLPGGEWVLFTVGTIDSPGDYDEAAVDAIHVATGERRRIAEGARIARYVPPGYLLFQRESSLLAARFDLDALEMTSAPVSLVEGVGGEGSSGAGYWAASDVSTLLYAPEIAIQDDRLLVLVDRDGNETALPVEPRAYWHPRFSPDGSKIAFSIGGGAAAVDDIWVLDIASGRLDRVTFGNSGGVPTWTPDGHRLAFARGGTGATGIYWKRADGSGEDELLLRSREGQVVLPDTFRPDGAEMLVTEASGSMGIFRYRLDSREIHSAFVDGPWSEWSAAFAPDGRFVAYSSTENGAEDVFVTTYPEPTGKWQLSMDGGSGPVWSADGSEVYFASPAAVMAVPIDRGGDGIRPGLPRQLFTGPFKLRTAPIRNFDVAPDGRFVMVKELYLAQRRQLVLMQGWDASSALPASPR